MNFSYDSSLPPWRPTETENKFKIRILDLHPPPWYSRFLPASLAVLFPVHATLKWVELTRAPADPTADPKKWTPDLFSLDESESPYKALSYTWGELAATEIINVNDGTLRITGSLATALRHLRPSREPLRIWIDQICINQEDDKEKSEQVANMNRIYQSSEEALVWLGPGDETSDGVMEVLLKMGHFAEKFDILSYYKKDRLQEFQAIDRKQNPDDPMTIEYHNFCDSLTPLFTYDIIVALLAFYRRPWFQRTWVVQEVALPPKATFICGTQSMQVETLMVVHGMILLSMLGRIFPESQKNSAFAEKLDEMCGINTLQLFVSTRQRRKARDRGDNDGDSLFHLLQRAHVENHLQAKFGCDRIYGLLGLAKDAAELNIKIDYSKEEELRTATAYTCTARALILSGNVDLLIFAQQSEKDTTLPSWVPDWRLKINRSFAWLRDDKRKPLFKASAELGSEIIDEGNDRVLAIMGYKVDEIEELGGPWNSGNEIGAQVSRVPYDLYLSHLTQVRQLCLQSEKKGGSIYSSPERRAEAVWRVPVGDITQDEVWEPLRATSAWAGAYEHCIAQLEYKEGASEVDPLVDQGTGYRIRMQQFIDKRPFLSKIGYIGMGPSHMEPGDAIVVLTGASVPFIVRPLGDGKYQFLGECYCDGIMDEEAVNNDAMEKIILV